MKRATAILAALLFVCSCLAACSAPAANFNHVKVSGLKFTGSDSLARETQGLPDKFDDSKTKTQVTGFSPDGRQAILWDRENNAVLLVSAMGDGASATVTPGKDFMAMKKHPVWSKDGKSFLFTDTFVFGYELNLMRSTNSYVFKLENGSFTCDKATDISTTKNILNGGSLICSQTLSADGKSVVYVLRVKSGWELCKSKISSQDETVLLKQDSKDSDGFFANDALELKPGLLLCTLDNNNSKKPDTLFLYDSAKNKQTDLDNDTLDLPDGFRYFDMRGWSDDRRTVLVTAWSMQADLEPPTPQISAFYLFRFDAGFTSMSIQKIALDSVAADEHTAADAVLSADGKYIASFEMTGGTGKVYETALYSLEKKQRSVLETGDKPMMYPVSVLSGYQQTFFFTNDKRLIVSYRDSWKVYKLQ